MNIEIVAEIAQGFEGCENQSRLLLRAAATSGADAAKYQLIYADELATPDYKHYDLYKTLEMPDGVWENIATYAADLGIHLYFDIFGYTSLKLAEKVGAAAIKLHPTDIANLGLLEAVAKSSVTMVLLGFGGAYAEELKNALEILSSKKVVILLGYQGYPTSTETNQIDRVRTLSRYFHQSHSNVSMGFADHASPDTPLRYSLAATAVGAGATLIEKHITLAQVMKLEDFESALNPDLFKEFVSVIKDCGMALGVSHFGGDFGMSVAEKDYRTAIRRHVVLNYDLEKDHVLSSKDLVLKRTSLDEPITDLTSAYDRKLKNKVKRNSPLKINDI
jgi:N,N'-diacetyllegionaminate synthase